MVARLTGCQMFIEFWILDPAKSSMPLPLREFLPAWATSWEHHDRHASLRISSMLGDTFSVRPLMSLLCIIQGWLALGQEGAHSSCGDGDVHRDRAALILGASRFAESFQEGAVLHVHLHHQYTRLEGVQQAVACQCGLAGGCLNHL